MKEKKLNLLILEDNPDYAKLMIRELKKEGFVFEWKRVETEKTFKKALAEKPDIILADYKLPLFDGMTAIKLQQQIAPDIPLILVTGSIGEELAVECIKAGATDYILKDRLSRLFPVIKRALKEAEAYQKKEKAEKSLRESEERFKYLVKNSNDVIIIIDENRKEIFVSDSVECITGFTPAETVEHSGFEFLHPDDIDHMSKTLSKLLETPGVTIRDEYRHRRKGGGWVYLEAIGTNYMHEPSVEGIVLNVRDITERKKTEEEIRKLSKTVEATPIAIVISDLEGKIEYVNPGLLTLGGYEDDKDIIGESIFMFTDEVGVKCLQQEVNPVLLSGSPWKGEIPVKRKDGSIFPAEMICSVILDENKHPKYLLSNYNDITELKQAEQTLKESEKKYRQLAETAKDVIMVLDLKGNVKYINQEGINLSRYSKEELFKMNVNDVLSSDNIPISDKFFAKRLAGDNNIFIYEIDFFNKKGDKIPVEIKSSLITEQGKPSGVLIIARDITERKKVEEKEKKYHKNIELLSETAMQFVKFPVDKNIYNFIGEQLKELIGKDSYVIVNSVNTDKNILTIRTVLGMGKLSEKVAGLLGKHPVGMTFNAKDKYLVYLSDGKLRLYKEGLYEILLKTVPKTVCNSLEKLLNIKTIYGIGFTKDNELFGTIIILIKEGSGELKNKQIIEVFLKQASIAIQKRQAEKALIEKNENFQQVVSNITTVVWKADIGKNGTFENTYISPVVDELLELPAGTLQNDWDKYFRYIKPEYLERVNNAFKEAIKSPGKLIDCEYEVLKDNGQTAWFHSKGRCFEKNGKFHVFGSTMDITDSKKAEEALRESEQQLSGIIDSITDHISMIDEHHNIVWANEVAKRLFGLDLIGKKCYAAYHRRDKVCDLCVVSKTFEDGKIHEHETEVIEEDGNKMYFWCSANVSSLHKDGRPRTVIEISRDITERKQAEEALKKEKTTLNNIINLNPYSIQICDKDGYHIRANQAFMDIFNTVPPREWSIFNDSILKKAGHQGLIRKVKSGDIVQVPETFYNPHDISPELPDKRECISSVNFPILNPDGEVENIVIMHENLTERKKAEEKLRLFSQSVESSVDGIAMSEHGRITYVNEAFATILGYSKYELIGKEIAFIYAEDQRPKLEEAVKATMEGRWTGELIGKRKNDELFPLEISASRVVDDKGKVIAIMASHRDITERKRAEETLRESEEKYRTLVESIVEGIGNVDKDENFTYVNQAAADIFGYSKEEMIGKNLKELTSPEMFRKVLDQTSKGRVRKSHQYELTIIRKNDEHRIITVTITPKFNDNGVYQGTFGIFHDITERKQAEEDLKLALVKATESDRMKTSFLNIMSHELRTPLNAVIGFSEMIADFELSEEEIKKFANIIKTSGNNLLSIINDIFDITLIETDKVQIIKEKFSVNETLEHIYSSFIGNDKILNSQINLILNKELAEDSDIVQTDEIKFHQILINLIGNAFKFTHQGTIEFGYTVETDNDTSFLKFYVKDSGVGIPEDKQSIIFERFRQADNSSTRKFGGAGLGLFISEKLVKLLGGKIWVESEEGKGSTFYFTLPFEPVAKTTVPFTDKTKKAVHNWKDKTILIVDDNDEVYNFFEAVLKKTNAKLVRAKYGKEAISLFESNKEIDLILMDIQLTDISGYEVTKQIKKINKDIPIIAQTSYALFGDREKSLEAGCDDYITKPIEKQVLLQMIEKYLDG